MQLVDTHCHIQFKDYRRPDEVMARAARVNVKRIICVGTNLDDSQAAADLAAKHKTIWAAAGVHPHEAQDYLNDKHAEAKLKKLLAKPRVVAIGEIGLDYYKNYSAQNVQREALKQQLGATAGLKLPYIFHVREAWSDFWPIIDSHPGIKGVIHSFSAGQSELEAILTRGFYVGLNGIMTFTKQAEQLEAAKAVPQDRLVLETDAPFLTPAPKRNELCEPRHIRTIAEFLAVLRAESLDDLAIATTRNAERLFNL